MCCLGITPAREIGLLVVLGGKRTQSHLTWLAGQVTLSLVHTCDKKTKPDIRKYFLKRVSINSLKADTIHLLKACL